MWEPRSIFTGNDTTPLDTTPEQRRLGTAGHREPLSKTPDAPNAHTSCDTPPSFPVLQPPWTPTPPPERNSIQRPGSAPLHSGGGERGKVVAWTPSTVIGIKRPPPPGDHTPATTPSRALKPISEPLHKRRRVPPRSRHSLDHLSLSKSAQFRLDSRPPSPLFFSSRSTRPQLPPRFSSSEAAARMLSKAREDSGIKTVTLARGTFSGLSPPGPASRSSGRTSERSSVPQTVSPDARDKSDPLRMLGSVGIVELLEQDGRPTFIVDIGDFTNYTEAANLQILFANSALRSSSSTWDLVAGKPTDSATDDLSHATCQFRSWLLSTVVQSDNVELNPPPVEHGGIIWSCYTLRKRLRVVSGAFTTHATSLLSTSAANESAICSAASVGLVSENANELSSTSIPNCEPQDYFGATVCTVTQGEPTPPMSAPQPGPTYYITDSSDDGSGLFPKPSRKSIPSIEESTSFANECVLRAHTAGDVDPFHRETTSQRVENQDMGFFDWTRLALSPSLPRHIQFARSIDWASTALGPIEYWSNDLRAMCNLIM
jgi:hypothetical protein